MRKFILAGLLTGTFLVSNGQQLPYYSQYMVNPYLLNPGVAGSETDMLLNVGYRAQWSGMEDAPRTGVVSTHTRIKNKHGAGLMLMSDKTGPSARMGAQLSYAYHLTLNSSGTKLGLGLGTQIFQHTLAADKLTTDQPGDMAIQNAYYKTISPDAIFGAWVYHKKYFAGLSVPQLLQSTVDYDGNQGPENRLRRHMFLTGGYRYAINEQFLIEPSLLFKYVAAAPLQFDINTKAYYEDKFWLGLSYRDKESIVTMLGIKTDFVSAGYAYDITLSDLKKYSSGSHEIFLSINIVNRPDAPPPVKRNTLDGPGENKDQEPPVNPNPIGKPEDKKDTGGRRKL